MNPIFNPLVKEHPLITGGIKCPMCQEGFKEGERTTLLSVNANVSSTVRAVAAHARCAFLGVKTEKGIIVDIKNGDESDHPVVTADGSQWNLEELGIPT